MLNIICARGKWWALGLRMHIHICSLGSRFALWVWNQNIQVWVIGEISSRRRWLFMP